MSIDRLSPPQGDETLSIARRSLAVSVAEHLREMIVQGVLEAGKRVQVAALAGSLAVSATPVREALIILAEDRLVELLPNRGARILPYTLDEALALFEVLAALDALAARLTVLRMSSADLADLEASHAAMAAHHRRREREPYVRLNSQIHAAVVALSANPDLIATHARLDLRARRGRYITIVDDTRWDEAMGEHEALMDAFRRCDAAFAGAIWQTHLQHMGRAVANALQRETRHTNVRSLD